MGTPGLIIRDRNSGREKMNSTFNTATRLGLIDIGGAGAAQVGGINNPLLAEGEPFHFIVDGPVNFVRDNVYPRVWIDGTSVRWSYPAAGASDYERPRLRILYGIK